MEALFTDEVVGMLASVVAAVISLVIGKLVKDTARRAVVEKVVDAAIPIAFHVVQEISRRTPNKIDDKVALGLEKLAEISATHGVELTEEHKARAALVFSALHAQSKVQESK